jgi:hypothetical protein
LPTPGALSQVDFTGIAHVSSSFADEFLGRLITDHQDVNLTLCGLTSDVERSSNRCLQDAATLHSRSHRSSIFARRSLALARRRRLGATGYLEIDGSPTELPGGPDGSFAKRASRLL